ncbi:NAD(P)-dependent oxidoreductase [uncultured Roseobacter sp.]|uniref:NAD-dependent epimerase/dehydratase family protein n=1 Tax=uncultured Roseobacter sp. TaxID=114847 RepID=UPI002605B6C6|nr:NAD(P)-dependent oxidoreductase [uncultured Roseobacter sp.]
MSLLITGASGAIGGYIHARCRAAGWRVHAVDIMVGQGIDALDVSDRAAFADYIADHRINRVIHCAGRMDVAGVCDPLELVSSNVLGLTNLCSILKDNPTAQVVFMSSRGVYPWLHADRVPQALTEDHPTQVDVERSVYDMTKVSIEMIAERYAIQYGLTVTGLRLASTFGLGKTTEKHGHQTILVDLLHAARAGESRHVPGADQCTDFLYYGDIWQACLRVLAAPRRDAPMRMNVSGGVRPLRDYVSALPRHFPQANVTAGDGLDYLGTGGFGYVNLDPALARQTVGYEAAYTPEDAFAEMDRLLRGAPHPFVHDFADLVTSARPETVDRARQSRAAATC